MTSLRALMEKHHRAIIYSLAFIVVFLQLPACFMTLFLSVTTYLAVIITFTFESGKYCLLVVGNAKVD